MMIVLQKITTKMMLEYDEDFVTAEDNDIIWPESGAKIMSGPRITNAQIMPVNRAAARVDSGSSPYF